MIHDAHDKQEEHMLGWYEAETDRLKVTGAQDAQMAQIQADLARDIAATVPEPVEEPQEQPAEVEPEVDMNKQTIDQMMANHGQVMEHHQALAGQIDKLHQAMTAPRTRIPVRDAEGNLTHVIDQMAPQDQPATPNDFSQAPKE